MELLRGTGISHEPNLDGGGKGIQAGTVGLAKEELFKATVLDDGLIHGAGLDLPGSGGIWENQGCDLD